MLQLSGDVFSLLGMRGVISFYVLAINSLIVCLCVLVYLVYDSILNK